MDEEAPRYWLWSLGGAGAGLILALLMVLAGVPRCGLNPAVRTRDSDVQAMPEPKSPEKGMVAKVQRGRYLATVAGCAYCHTPVDPLTGALASQALSGGVAFRSRSFGTLYSANLTPDLSSGLGEAKDEQNRLRAALRSGLSTRGNTMHPAAMPWHLISHASTEDLHAVLLYLLHTTAVSRAMPPRGAPTKGDPDGVWMGLGAWSRRYD